MTTILVIDDDDQLRDLTVEMLEVGGYSARSARDGASGLAMARQDQPDLLLCDLQMPGMGGYEVLASLRHDPRSALIPVIFMTGAGGDENIRRGMNLGADDYLVKPVSTRMLLEAVGAHLGRSRAVRKQAAEHLDALRTELARSLLPHELLTPLTALMGLASLLKEEGAIEAGQVKEVADGILLSAQELERMITRFLLYAEIETSQRGGGLAAPEARAVLRQVVEDEAARARRGGDVELAPGAFESPMPAEHLRAMAQELVNNALKFSTPGSRVTVEGGSDADGCALTVRDGGRGMTVDQAEGLHRAPFLRRHDEQPGLGLGLTIVRRLARMYGASVSFGTTEPPGTKVTVQFGPPRVS